MYNDKVNELSRCYSIEKMFDICNTISWESYMKKWFDTDEYIKIYEDSLLLYNIEVKKYQDNYILYETQIYCNYNYNNCYYLIFL
jgi:hypothetical protein